MFKAVFVIFAAVVPSISGAKQGTACTGTISSLDDVDAAVECTTVNINSFTVPAGETFNLDLADGTTVNMGMLFFLHLLTRTKPSRVSQRGTSVLATRRGLVRYSKSGKNVFGTYCYP